MKQMEEREAKGNKNKKGRQKEEGEAKGRRGQMKKEAKNDMKDMSGGRMHEGWI